MNQFDDGSLYDELPSNEWDKDAVKRTLDELFQHAKLYTTSKEFNELMQFCGKFRFYAPFNAMLVHAQMPGAQFVAPAHRWRDEYGRTIKPNARPLVILQTMGPVMFVFDVADTAGGQNAIPLPREVEKPFEVFKGVLRSELERTIENAKRDGVRITGRDDGSQSAGLIRYNSDKQEKPLNFCIGKDKQGNPLYSQVPLKYDLLYNSKLGKEAQYATIVHELTHLYCGHLGTPNAKWWPDRRGLHLRIREFEAESATYLVCARLGIANPSAQYLANYFEKNQEVPGISLDRIMKSAGLIEKMGQGRLKARKTKEENE